MTRAEQGLNAQLRPDSAAGAVEHAAPARNRVIPGFVCSEIWGGNRPIDAPIELPGVRGRVFSQPCDGGRGGDIHYVSICSSGLLSRLCVADVAGHGEPVARVSGEIHRLLRRYMNNLDERRLLWELNQQLQDEDVLKMTTAAAVSYFPPARLLSVSYAGHPPAWYFSRRKGGWSRLRVSEAERAGVKYADLPLAVDPRTSFSRRRVLVRPGDRLLLVTDGVLEAPGPDGALFGDERVAEVLEAARTRPVGELLDRVMAALVAWTGARGLVHDDLTLLAVEFVPGPRAWGIWDLLKNRILGRRARNRGSRADGR